MPVMLMVSSDPKATLARPNRHTKSMPVYASIRHDKELSVFMVANLLFRYAQAPIDHNPKPAFHKAFKGISSLF